ncbi:hypothetical protein PQR02_15990 [Paraburkholderia sediminicola]|uniref:Uncharacterized protein n=1 Tax=Paraburkholderia rhynchosiae TaxID=487049 RepID=A0ACC7NJ31_9BURK
MKMVAVVVTAEKGIEWKSMDRQQAILSARVNRYGGECCARAAWLAITMQ